jgi:DegV family protein with EDD domain
MSVGILTDSTSDIPKDICEKYDIEVVPLKVIFDKKTFIDNVDITPEEFYKKLKVSEKLPTTTQPTPAEFIQFYKKMAERYDSIISIHISEKMSGTMASAFSAKTSLPDLDITIIDSKITSIPVGYVVMEAAKAVKEGRGKEEIIDMVNNMLGKIRILFLPKTLEYLRKGGRIGRAKSLLAVALKIQPILTVEDGEVAPYKNVRHWNRAKQQLIDIYKNVFNVKKGGIVIIGHSDNIEDAKDIEERAKEALEPKEIYTWLIGSVIGTHLGPGGVALCYIEI